MKTARLLMFGLGLLMSVSASATTFYLHADMVDQADHPQMKNLWFSDPVGGSDMNALGADFAGNRFELNGYSLSSKSTGGATTFPGTIVAGTANTTVSDVFTREWTVAGMDIGNTLHLRGRVWNAPAILNVGDLNLGLSGKLHLRTHNSNSTTAFFSVTGSLTGSGTLKFGHNGVPNDLNAIWNFSISDPASTFSGTVELSRGELVFNNAFALNDATFEIEDTAEDNTIVLANDVSFAKVVFGAATLDSGTYTAAELNTEFGTTRFSGAGTLSTGSPEYYVLWTDSYPALGAFTNRMDDPDFDGMNNMVEYALGGNPTLPDAAGILPTAGMDAAGGSNWLNYVYTRRLDAEARRLAYDVVSGTNLLETLDDPTEETGAAAMNLEFETVTNRMPTGNIPAGFIQLKIADALPIRIEESQEEIKVFLDQDLIVEFSDGKQYLRFRSSGQNDLWAGSTMGSMDLCWAYTDPGINDFECQQVFTKKDATSFEIRLQATKPSVNGNVEVVLTGTWSEERQGFEYLLSSGFTCPLADFYDEASEISKVKIEPLDWRIENISLTERIGTGRPNSPEVYDWFVYSHDQAQWTRSPKIHILYPVRSGSYPTIFLCTLQEGGSMGWLDYDLGGWLVYPDCETAGQDFEFELCWLALDVHCYMPGAVPPLGSQQELDLDYSLRFVPQLSPSSQQIVDASTEVEWRSLEEYHLPVFDHTQTNDFSNLISGKDEEYMWLASSYDCYRDGSVGYDDSYSVSINKSTSDATCWHAFTWSDWYVVDRYHGSYRVHAMVKTENCTGRVGLGVLRNYSKGWGVYSREGWDDDYPDLEWERSAQLSGTTGWTELTLDIIVNEGEETPRTIVLEQEGPGQCWFDNVIIEKLD